MTAETTKQSVETVPGFDAEAFEAFLATRNEPDWVTEARRSAFEQYQVKLAEPLDPEEWKRVDLRLFRPGQYTLKTNSEAPAKFSTLMEGRTEFAGLVTHVDGKCTQTELSTELAEQGVLFGNLADLVQEHRELLEPHIVKRAASPETDRFSAWHAAFWTGGTVLYVPRNVQFKQPLYSLIALANEAAADFSHTLVIMEEGSSATLLEETASASDKLPGLHVGAVELVVGREAHLRYVQLQNWSEQVYHIAHQTGSVENDGFLQWTVGGLGSKLAHIHQDVNLDGRGANAEVNGVTFGNERQLLSYYTQQSHNAPDTRSDLLYKQVLEDRSRGIWRGMIRVEPIAQKTDGYQKNDTLLLSDTCRADAIPGLEIEADDVRCTHGATAGRVDQDQLFYCLSRGMTEYEAMHMIVEGFFQIVYDRIPVEIVRETLSAAVEKKLGIGD